MVKKQNVSVSYFGIRPDRGNGKVQGQDIMAGK